jgi:hypothetical protein
MSQTQRAGPNARAAAALLSSSIGASTLGRHALASIAKTASEQPARTAVAGARATQRRDGLPLMAIVDVAGGTRSDNKPRIGKPRFCTRRCGSRHAAGGSTSGDGKSASRTSLAQWPPRAHGQHRSVNFLNESRTLEANESRIESVTSYSSYLSQQRAS